MRTFDPSLLVLLVLAALAAVLGGAAPAGAQEADSLVAVPQPVVFSSEQTGLRVQLPSGWVGSQAIDETELPGRATYRWESTDPAVRGATVVVERVTGLNPLMQERWRRGQVASGYQGLRPTAQLAEDAMIFGPGAGLEVAAGERVGRVYFVQRGQVFWAVHVAAPAATLAAAPALLDTLSRGIRLSDKEAGPAQASR